MNRTQFGTGNKVAQKAKRGYTVHHRGKSPTEAVNLLRGMQTAFYVTGQDRTAVLILCSDSEELLFNVAVLDVREEN